jgi:hypothetical protein
LGHIFGQMRITLDGAERRRIDQIQVVGDDFGEGLVQGVLF